MTEDSSYAEDPQKRNNNVIIPMCTRPQVFADHQFEAGADPGFFLHKSKFDIIGNDDVIDGDVRSTSNAVLFALKVPLRRSEQHFQSSLYGVFGFSISCLVLEIFRFFETCKLDVSDVNYSRITNYIYKIVNISVNNRQNSFKLCMSIAIW